MNTLIRRHARSTVSRAGRARGAAPGSAGGFTLLEILIAVGATALIAVGIASIFQSVGETVRVGKRVSALNQTAAQIERHMREDFRNIDRRGFMVIRNALAVTRDNFSGQVDARPVELFPDDNRPRRRRVDEIMFFASGDYVSARPPLDDRFVARANSARIYYGHGQRWVPQDPVQFPNSPYHTPISADITDSRDPQNIGVFQSYANLLNDAGLGQPPTGGRINPNQYASSWVLARQATLLRPPMPSAAALPAGNVLDQPATSQLLLDTPVQIALQPAMPSIFRGISRLGGCFVQNYSGQNDTDTGLGRPVWQSAGTLNSMRTVAEAGSIPSSASGLVDIAATSVPEIMSFVQGAPIGGLAFAPAEIAGCNFLPATFTRSSGLALAQAWMLEAFPSNSPHMTFVAAGSGFEAQRVAAIDQRRVRVETYPPGLVEAMRDQASANTQAARTQAVRLADQQMLLNQAFITGVSEFVVEWSFGKRGLDQTNRRNVTINGVTQDVRNQILWHGLRPTGEEIDAPTNASGWRRVHSAAVAPYRPAANRTGANDLPEQLVTDAQGRPIVAAMIHGAQLDQQNLDDPDNGGSTVDALSRAAPGATPAYLVSYFGYSALDSAPFASRTLTEEVVSVPLPRLLRFTFRLTDPQDPSIEQTYQVVIDLDDPGV
jgi:type II secretory pathway pseudopilin PulG